MSHDSALSMLGIATRAGKVCSGEFSVEKAVKEGRACLVIVAGDASDNTKKSHKDMCKYYNVPYCEYANKESLGRYVGKEYRASVAINDQGLADTLVDKMNCSRNAEV